MLPHIHFLGLPLPMYATMVVIGAIAAVIYLKLFTFKRERVDRISQNRLMFVSILSFAALALSALIFNSFFHSIEEGRFVIGGITWLGGVIGVIPAAVFLIHKFVPKDRGNAINRFSNMVPGLVIAHAFGRIGCFLGGCCYGDPTSSFLGVSFPAGSLAGKQYPDKSVAEELTKVVESTNEAGETIETILYPSIPVLPTQLIEAVFEVLLFVAMILLYKRFKNYNIEIYCFVYGAFRFALEFLRGDNRGSTGIFVTPSQLMSIILFIGATMLILFRNRKIFKKLYRKCEVWREEAKTASPSGNRPIFASAERTAYSIRELHKLMEEGIITEEEFNEKKKELLKRL